MEQLNYLLGYVGVFLWAFGICQVKVTKDKKKMVIVRNFGYRCNFNDIFVP